jgi:hypothetical protein
MISDLLRSIPGLEIFPVIALCLFVIVFAMIIWWVARLDKLTVHHMSRLPLDHKDDSEGAHTHE